MLIHRRDTQQARWSLGLIVALATFAVLAPQADASRLRRLAPSVTSFATDGVSYAAWQVTPASPITVFDTRIGIQSAIPEPGCVLEGRERTGAIDGGGRFLLSCFKEPGDGCFVVGGIDSLFRCGEKPLGEEPTEAERAAYGVRVQRLLDVQTGVSISLPERISWTRVGTRYLEGLGACSPWPYCFELYDIDTETVSVQSHRYVEATRELELADLDRVGAPSERVCHALRRTVLTWLKYGNLGEDLAYYRGVFAHRTHNYQNVRVERCNGHSTFLPGPSESAGRYLRRSEPTSFDLGEGFLTWDTGHSASGADMDEQSNERGTLSSYQLSDGTRRTWKLPRLSISGNQEYESPGVYGYSTHTANSVLWIATRTTYQVGEAGGTIVATSSVYAASLN
jgi:hypothetical protein